MQSLKSTAFAVTLLAISFGLYCVSSTDNGDSFETDLVDPIKIEDGLTVTDDGSSSYDLGNTESSNQFSVATNVPLTNNDSNLGQLPSMDRPALPELPKINAPDLTAPKAQFASTKSNPVNFSAPKLPSLKTSNSFAPSLNKSPATDRLELPEIATRQPATKTPENRDEGLIDALKSNDFNPNANQGNQSPAMTTAGEGNDNSFKPTTSLPSSSEDNSFNSQASAIAGVGESGTVKTAFGTTEPNSGSSNMFGGSSAPATPAIALWSKVDQLVEQDNYFKALEELSLHYASDDIKGPQRQKLQAWLDALAGKVIYSTEHHIAGRPYVVRQGDTLDSLATQLKVPAEVIYNINRAKFVGTDVSPGMELKIVKGPFHAEVDMKSQQMTLFVGNLYAGRFPVTVGVSGNPSGGKYNVVVKSQNGYTWRDASGKDHPAGSPENGYGPYWIGLSNSLCVHAIRPGTTNGHPGCIGLKENDAKDVFGILSKDSQIRIVQ